MSFNLVHKLANANEKCGNQKQLQCKSIVVDDNALTVNGVQVPIPGAALTFMHTNNSGDVIWKNFTASDIPAGLPFTFLHTDAIGDVVWKALTVADIPAGADGQVLTSESGLVSWQDPASETNQVGEYNILAGLPYAFPTGGNLIVDNTLFADAALTLNPVTGELLVGAGADGLYEVEAFIAGAISDTTTEFQIELRRDGAIPPTFAQAKTQLTSSAGSWSSARAKGLVQLVAGQNLSIYCSRTAGAGTGSLSTDLDFRWLVKRIKA